MAKSKSSAGTARSTTSPGQVAALAEEASTLIVDAQAIVRVTSLALCRPESSSSDMSDMENDVIRILGVVESLLDQAWDRTTRIEDGMRADAQQ